MYLWDVILYMYIALFKNKLSSLSPSPSAILLGSISTVTQQRRRKDAILTLKHCHGFKFDNNLCTLGLNQ